MSKFSAKKKLTKTRIGFEEYFQDHVWISNPPTKDTTIQSFVRNRWLTNYDIDTFFLNFKKNYNFIFFAYKRSKYIYSFAGLEDKISKANQNGIEKVFVALNAYRKVDGTCQ